MLRGGREFLRDGVDHPGVLGGDGIGVGLVEDGPDQGGHPRLGTLGHLGQQIAQVVGAAALPGGAGKRGADRAHQAAVGVGDDQPDARQASGGQRPQECQPAGAVLVAGDVQAEDFPAAVGIDPDCDQGMHVDVRPPSRTLMTSASSQTKV